MAKITDKMPYEIWLDLYYAEQLCQDFVNTTAEQLKDLKAAKRRAVRLLKMAAVHYETITGKVPVILRSK